MDIRGDDDESYLKLLVSYFSFLRWQNYDNIYNNQILFHFLSHLRPADYKLIFLIIYKIRVLIVFCLKTTTFFNPLKKQIFPLLFRCFFSDSTQKHANEKIAYCSLKANFTLHSFDVCYKDFSSAVSFCQLEALGAFFWYLSTPRDCVLQQRQAHDPTMTHGTPVEQ